MLYRVSGSKSRMIGSMFTGLGAPIQLCTSLEKAFGLCPDRARRTKTLAANQRLYNGFLVSGLNWGIW